VVDRLLRKCGNFQFHYIKCKFCGNIIICFCNFKTIRQEIYANNTFTCLLCIYVQFNSMYIIILLNSDTNVYVITAYNWTVSVTLSPDFWWALFWVRFFLILSDKHLKELLLNMYEHRIKRIRKLRENAAF